MPNKQLWIKIKDILLKVIKLVRKANPFTKDRIIICFQYIKRSWKSIAIILPLILFAYYSIGGYVTNSINKDTSVQINLPSEGLAVIKAGADLIKNEVDDNMWTPNLPFIFPGYVLDNMPAYQTGVLEAVKYSVKAFNDTYDSTELSNAYELLKYPPNVWILSKEKDLSLAPSSGAQYRKARKELLKFNESYEFAAADDIKLQTTLLKTIEKHLKKVSKNLANQVLEFSSDWVDFNADSTFYNAQGGIYGDYILLKSMMADFKSNIVNEKQYDKYTSVLKTLEDALALNPLIIRNGEEESVMSANHLITLNYYVTKSLYQLSNMQ